MLGDIEKIEGNELESKVEDNVQFIFKDEIFRRFMEERNKCIRSILWTAEVIIENKESNDFIKLRKSVLDSVNEFYRKMYVLTDKYLV